MSATNWVFIVGCGRSGSKSLATALSKQLRAIVLHEPEPNLFEEYASLYEHENRARSHEILETRKFPAIRRLARNEQYVEINGALTPCIPELLVAGARVILLVRDGRDVVRSIMDRHHYREPLVSRYPPPVGAMPSWRAMSRFAKVCWLWNLVNITALRYLRAATPKAQLVVRLEDLIAGQTHNLCEFFGISQLQLPVQNRTESPRFPCWPLWSGTQRHEFVRFAGRAMKALYPNWSW
jgi:hypothetical protein